MNRLVRTAVCILCSALSCSAASCATTHTLPAPSAEPSDACVALQTVGFGEIMERAVQRGLVRRVATEMSMAPPQLSPGRFYAQAALAMWVFQLTEEAVEAGVPQRAGTAIVAGCTAAVVAIWEMVRRRKPSCTDHYVACMEKIGWTPGNHWKMSVCGDCKEMCQNGNWPYKNTSGEECPGVDR